MNNQNTNVFKQQTQMSMVKDQNGWKSLNRRQQVPITAATHVYYTTFKLNTFWPEDTNNPLLPHLF